MRSVPALPKMAQFAVGCIMNKPVAEWRRQAYSLHQERRSAYFLELKRRRYAWRRPLRQTVVSLAQLLTRSIFADTKSNPKSNLIEDIAGVGGVITHNLVPHCSQAGVILVRYVIEDQRTSDFHALHNV